VECITVWQVNSSEVYCIYDISLLTEAKRCMSKFLSAVQGSNQLKIRLPCDADGWENVRQGGLKGCLEDAVV